MSSCVLLVCTLEESDKDVERRADVLRRFPGQQEVLSAEQPGRTGLRRVVQAARQLVELRQVNVREPDQRPVARRQVVSDASVESRFQRILKIIRHTNYYYYHHHYVFSYFISERKILCTGKNK